MSATTALVSYILITLVVEFPLIIIYLNTSGVFVALFFVNGAIFFYGKEKKKYSRKFCMDHMKNTHKRLIIDQNKMVACWFHISCTKQKQNFIGRQIVTLILGTHVKDLGESFWAHFEGSQFLSCRPFLVYILNLMVSFFYPYASDNICEHKEIYIKFIKLFHIGYKT